MLAVVSPLRSTATCNTKDDDRGGEDTYQMEAAATARPDFDVIDFPDFASAGSLLDSIDFDDLFLDCTAGMGGIGGIGVGGGGDELLADFDPDLFAEFSVSSTSEDQWSTESADNNNNNNKVDFMELNSSIDGVDTTTTATCNYSDDNDDKDRDTEDHQIRAKEGEGAIGSDEEMMRKLSNSEYDSGREENESSAVAAETTTSGRNRSHEKRKKWSSSSSYANGRSSGNKENNGNRNNDNHAGKRKSKVDWTPELHRRFVQAVEQLGVDKAVPSRILEIMGIDCLTRHNIASHLQKYRSHRKHMLAREVEAATWSQKRQMYGVAVGGAKRNMQPWTAPPTMGFPPPMRPIHPAAGFRPLHVWGHPTVDMWPKHLIPPPLQPPPPPAWVPPPHHPPVDPSFWHPHHQRRFQAPPVTGIPPHAMYKLNHGIVSHPPAAASSGLGHPPPELHPTKESIDAAIGDVLAKPWLPLPIGLKPPSVDGVLVELQRQGVSKIPPPTATCA